MTLAEGGASGSLACGVGGWEKVPKPPAGALGSVGGRGGEEGRRGRAWSFVSPSSRGEGPGEEEEEEQGPVKLECTEESAAFLQQAAEVEHRHLHQHHHLHHTLQLSHLEPERTQPSVYSPLVRPFRSADAISICVGSRADSLPLCCDMTAEAPRGAANAGHGCGL